MEVAHYLGGGLDPVLELDLLTIGCLVPSVDRLKAERVIHHTQASLVAAAAAFSGETKIVDEFLEPFFASLGNEQKSAGINELMGAIGKGF